MVTFGNQNIGCYTKVTCSELQPSRFGSCRIIKTAQNHLKSWKLRNTHNHTTNKRVIQKQLGSQKLKKVHRNLRCVTTVALKDTFSTTVADAMSR